MGDKRKMTKEELEKEADKYADNYATPDLDCSFRAYMFEASKEGYLAGAEPREKRIIDLETEVKVLRTFGDKEHCENYRKKYGNYLTIEPYNADEWQRPKLNGCCIHRLKSLRKRKQNDN